MNVLLLHNFYRVSGGEDVFVLQQKKLLQNNNHKVETFFTFSNKIKEMTFISKLLLPLNAFFSLSAYKKTMNICEENKIDVAHVHNIFPLLSVSVFIALKKKNIPIVYSLHNFRLFLNKNNYSAIFSSGYGFSVLVFLIQRILGFFSLVAFFIAPSSFMSKVAMENGIPPEKMVCIPHFTSVKNAGTLNKKAKKTFMYLGRISYEKGIDRLHSFFMKHKKYNLVICTPQMSPNQMNRWSLLSNVKVVIGPERFVISKILQFATALIIPSRWEEPFGLVAIEAMKQSTIPIVTNKGSLHEIVKEGLSGYVISSNKSFFEKDLLKVVHILTINENMVKRIGEKARKQAEMLYSEKKYLKNLIAVYQKAMCIQKLK